MKKLVIVINGTGTSGKDSIIEELAEDFSLMNESSIDPIKVLGEIVGTERRKDPKTRKFLSDMKRVCEEYNSYTTNYLLQKVEDFQNNNKQLLFVHIREGEQIDKFKNQCMLPCKTVLVKRQGVGSWGNDSDDNVDDYDYDYQLFNESICESAKHLSNVIQEWLNDIVNINIDLETGIGVAE